MIRRRSPHPVADACIAGSSCTIHMRHDSVFARFAMGCSRSATVFTGTAAPGATPGTAGTDITATGAAACIAGSEEIITEFGAGGILVAVGSNMGCANIVGMGCDVPLRGSSIGTEFTIEVGCGCTCNSVCVIRRTEQTSIWENDRQHLQLPTA